MVFLYSVETRYSINSLLAVVDRIEGVKYHLVRDLNELLETARLIVNRGDQCIVAFSLLTTLLVRDNYYIELRGVVEKLKKMGCLTITGGPHPSGDPIGTLSYFGFDYVFIGEAEESLAEFLYALLNKQDPRSVKGVFFLDNDRPVYTGVRKPIDLDKYDPFPYWRGIVNPIEITRGCPHGCFYCQVSYLHGRQYRHRSIEKISFIVEQVVKLGVRDIRFISPDSLAYGLTTSSRSVNLDAIEKLLEELSKKTRNTGGRIFLGSFPSEVRPEHVTEESIKLLRKYVANKSIIMGAQSGSEEILRRINRGHTVEDVVLAVEISLSNGFIPDVDLIFGFPGETVEDMEKTLNLARKLVNMGARIHLHYYIPLPGTPFGMKKPTRIPEWIKKEIWRIIGMGRGYGDWIKQEELSWRIIELHERGVIAPKWSKAPGVIT